MTVEDAILLAMHVRVEIFRPSQVLRHLLLLCDHISLAIRNASGMIYIAKVLLAT